MAKRKRGYGTIPMDFLLPDTDWEVPTELPDLRGVGSMIATDAETRDDGLSNNRGAGWVYRAGYVAGVSVAVQGRSLYVPIRHPETQCFPKEQVARWLSDHLHGPQRPVFHNAPYDVGWYLADLGIEVPLELHDTMGMAFTLDENRLAYNLDATARWQGVQGKDERLLRAAADAYGVDAKSEMWKLPAKYVGPYAAQDAAATLELAQVMLPKLEAQGLLDAYELEAELIPMCVEIRRRGVRVSTDRAERAMEIMYARSQQALVQLSEKAAVGRQWTIKDVRSNGFLTRMFDAAQVPYPKTPNGQPSFESEWMLKVDHWLPQLVVAAKANHEAAEKFVGNYILGYSHMGRLHSEMHQFRDDRGGTVTTRFSYSDPPLQQMPSRNPDIAPLIRGIFLPEPGEVWGALDYSQQEYRLMVHFAKVCGMAGVDRAIEQYRSDPDTDFHSLVAQLTGLPRRKAKDVNFAKAFGAGVPKFALMTGMTLDDARTTMSQYDDEMPFIKRLGEFCQQRADRRGYVRMLDGFRGRFDRWEPRWIEWERVKVANERARQEGLDLPKTSPCDLDEARARVADPDHPWTGKLKRAMTHKAMNKLIQGSAARMTKMAMRQCWREGIVPVLQLHDELDFSLADIGTGRRAAEIMRDIVQLEVPMMVDQEYGGDWGSAKHKEDEEGFDWDALRAA